jgi:hypothetical protein
MDRRTFCSTVAALGSTAALPALGAPPTENQTSRTDAPGTESLDALRLAELHDETTRQTSTFNLARKSKTIPIPRGKRVTIASAEGAGYIAQFWLTFPGWFWQHWNPRAPVNQSILKTLILRIYWDGAKNPAVAAPVGDFFGAGLGEVTSFASRYFGTSSGGFFCKWPMPFRQGFRVELENLDPEIDTDVFCNVLYQLTGQVSGRRLGYFHAQFNTRRCPGASPVQIADVHGQGHYSGCLLYMQGEDRNYLSFLEAPEHVFVDEDWEAPRIVGTGLEDYFLGGWYFREGPFIGPYHGVPSKDTFNASVAMYRVHEADAIHFKERLKFAFVNPWAPDRLRPFAFSSVAFLYLDMPDGQGPAIGTANDLLCWYRTRNSDHPSIP